jgi:hypothetical protein
MSVLPSDPVTFSETLAITVLPTESRRESMESSSAAWISLPTGRVRAAAVEGAALIPAVEPAVLEAVAVSDARVEMVSSAVAVSADAVRTVSAPVRTVSAAAVLAMSGFAPEVSGAEATVSTLAVSFLTVSFGVLATVSLRLPELSGTGAGLLATGGA